ncbi:hypothetical protein J4466_05755 [Candidatus Pacearchaeota archaeon]|nr:hypothetical protein [Candidatus Pacearchaeota archaeon]
MALKDKLKRNAGIIAVVTAGITYSLGTSAISTYNSYLKHNYPVRYELKQVERGINNLESQKNYFESEMGLNNPQNILDYIADAPQRMIRGIRKGTIDVMKSTIDILIEPEQKKLPKVMGEALLLPIKNVASVVGADDKNSVEEVIAYSLIIGEANREIGELKEKQRELESRVRLENQ